MKIIKSKEIGFCFGVKNAYKITNDALLSAIQLYTIGPLTHNKEVIVELEKKGVKVISSKDDVKPGIAIIRSHGLSFKEREKYEKKGFTLIDATCPVVLANQKKALSSDKELIIIGNAEHAEVKTLKNEDESIIIISKEEDLIKLDKNTEYNAIIQTTFSSEVLKKIKENVKKHSLMVHYLNSICPVSTNRREEIAKLSLKVEAIFVIGDKQSENSKALAEVAKSFGKPTFFIENEGEITKDMLNYEVIGLASGASCPDYLVDRVINYINEVSNGKI